MSKTHFANDLRSDFSRANTLERPSWFHSEYSGHNPALEAFIPPDTSTVLDVGCGRGGNAAWLVRKGITVDGVSWNPEELLAAKEFCRRLIRCDLNNGIAEIENQSYDCIICSHVLEHIAYPQQLLKDLDRALVPGGCLLVAIPNLFFWSDRIKLILGRWDYEESGTFDYTHLRWYTVKSMSRLLSSAGFVADEFLADGWIPLPGARFILGTALRKRINATACRVSPGLFGRQLIFRVKKSL
jgi:2-polyprenyl-3-methyl-5-hydroxy-6-metoxy-1,4-benzoquinol methylase